MTRTDHIAAIRTACIKANPEITSMKFACEVRVLEDQHFHYYMYRAPFVATVVEYGVEYLGQRDETWSMYAVKNHDIIHLAITKYEVIGRPIRLADVLLAIEERVNTFMNFDFIGNWPDAQELVCKWSLRTDDLEQQSDEMVAFVASLL